MTINQEILTKIQDNKHITGKELAELFIDLVNSMGTRALEFSEQITLEHRYLQQESFNLFFACIEKWASQGSKYDARNQYAVKASEVMLQALKDNNLY